MERECVRTRARVLVNAHPPALPFHFSKNLFEKGKGRSTLVDTGMGYHALTIQFLIFNCNF